MFVSGGKLYATYDAGKIDFLTGDITQVIAPALYQPDVATGTAVRVGAIEFGLFMAIDSGGTIYAYSAPERPHQAIAEWGPILSRAGPDLHG